ncbi:MAG TPA: hypothetical protein VGK09_09940 [Rhodocyclaceae bacterium]|jgi:hypothetical protein
MNAPATQTMLGDDLSERIASERASAERVITAITALADKHGVGLTGLGWDQANFSSAKDPFSGEESLVARWAGKVRGTLSLRPGGWLYGEVDVCQPHPTKPGLWMEAVVAWGHVDNVKMEMRLLDTPK